MDKTLLKQYKKNMRFLKKNRPKLYEALKRQSYDTDFDISIRMEYEKPVLYIGGKKAMHGFEEKLQKIYPLIKSRLEKRQVSIEINFESDYWQDSLHYEVLRNIEKHYKSNKNEGAVENRHIPMMLIYGVGFGYHIKEILQHFKVYNLILIEQDINLIRPSLYVLDWEELFEGVRVEIAIGRDEEILAKEIYNNIKKMNELYVHHFEEYILYDSELFYKTKKFLEEKKYTLGDNWGFFDDELISLKHTFQNIRYKPAFYIPTKQADIGKDVPVFIVGSGPSLDDAIDTLKKFRDRAIIFSCGTALKPLLKNGIWPDYEFILERTEPPYEALKMTLTDEEFENIKIIAVNLVYPKIFEPGKNRYMVLRGHDAGSLLFDAQYRVLHNLAPTVTNLAFSFALHRGFKKVYLFGIDLGVKGDKHHSKDSVYYLNQEFHIQKEYPLEIEGNFGGTVFTDNILMQTKLAFERNIGIYSDSYVYNCSDGGKIKGTYPLRHTDIELPQIDKKEAMQAIERSFKRDFFNDSLEKNIYKKYNELLNSFHLLRRYVRIALKSVENVADLYQKMNVVYEKIRNFSNRNQSAGMLFQATAFHQLSILLLTLYGIEEEKRVAYFKQGIDIIDEYFEEAEEKLVALLKK